MGCCLAFHLSSGQAVGTAAAEAQRQELAGRPRANPMQYSPVSVGSPSRLHTFLLLVLTAPWLNGAYSPLAERQHRTEYICPVLFSSPTFLSNFMTTLFKSIFP